MNPLLRRLQQLDHRQDGAVLTEFAMTLPIFLLIFGALLGLGNLTQGAIQAHADAAPRLWSDVFLAEDDEVFLEPGTLVKEREASTGTFVPRSTDISNIAITVDQITETDDGHWGEAQQFVDDWLNDPGGISNTHSAPVTMLTNPHDERMLGDSWAARGLLDDRLGQAMPGSGGTIFGDAYDEFVGTHSMQVNAGWAGGTRYAGVAATNEMIVDPGYGIPSTEYKISYSSRISPTSRPSLSFSVEGIDNEWTDDAEHRAWLAGRMWVDNLNEYSRLFELGTEDRIDHDVTTTVSIYED